MSEFHSNVFGLPGPLANAIRRRTYVLHADTSATRLLEPPYLTQLKTSDPEGCRRDVSEGLWSLLGTLMHKVLEEHADDEAIVEPEYIIRHPDFPNTTVQLHPDLVIPPAIAAIEDWKMTTKYSVRRDKIEWEQQLNLYALAVLLELGWRPDRLTVHAVLRDHHWTDAKKARSVFPPIPFMSIDFELWDKQAQLNFLGRRLEAHADPDPPPCTEDERWAQPSTWAIQGSKDGEPFSKASALFKEDEHGSKAAELAEADCLVRNKRARKGTSYEVQHRPGTHSRCERYCPARFICPVNQVEPYSPETDVETAAPVRQHDVAAF